MKSNNPNHIANLKPFKDGQDDRRNLKGNTGGKSISTILKELLQKKIPPQILKSKGFKDLGIEDADKLTTAELIALMNLVAVFYKLNPTQLKAMEMIMDRTEGKSKETVNIEVTEQPLFTKQNPTGKVE